MTHTESFWPPATSLLHVPLAIVRQELHEGRSQGRPTVEIAGRLLAADIGVAKHADSVVVSWLTHEHSDTKMTIRLRRTATGTVLE